MNGKMSCKRDFNQSNSARSWHHRTSTLSEQCIEYRENTGIDSTDEILRENLYFLLGSTGAIIPPATKIPDEGIKKHIWAPGR